MLQEDKDKLRELLKEYSAKEVMRDFSEIALSAADEYSDMDLKDKVKELILFAVAMEDLISGRPFLV